MPNYDKHPTMLDHSQESYGKYAKNLDGWHPEWYKDDTTKMAPQLATEALKRRRAAQGTPDASEAVNDRMKRLPRRVQTVRLAPSDIVIVSNLGDMPANEVQKLADFFSEKNISTVMFTGDINLTIVSQDTLKEMIHDADDAA